MDGVFHDPACTQGPEHLNFTNQKARPTRANARPLHVETEKRPANDDGSCGLMHTTTVHDIDHVFPGTPCPSQQAHARDFQCHWRSSSRRTGIV